MEGWGIKFGLFVHILLPLFLLVLTAFWDEMFLMFHGLLSGREASLSSLPYVVQTWTILLPGLPDTVYKECSVF